ncbi:cortex morphogenetic protein CmpA [Paenibacillus sp. CAA11]|nr:cortex morphogenetic protein CmpA [Paenibacillus sp. CAA11]AWB43823.1 cortex morphogenetic protein CmpA [Paenibacillus sp. CAA11]
MPKWLCNQMMRAFYKKDRRQVRLLNDCWFFYYNRRSDTQDAEGL